jgi:large subunit ribosomal protein LP0
MHNLINGYKKVLAVAVQTDYSWPEIDDLKDRIANPDAYASAAPAAAAATSGGDAPAAAAPAEDEEESDEDMGFGLFD